jgi:hypothetical protein
VKLTSLYLFAKNVRSLLHTYHYQQIFLHEFSMAYNKYVGETLQPKTYGYSSVEELLGAIPQVGVFLSFWESCLPEKPLLIPDQRCKVSPECCQIR